MKANYRIGQLPAVNRRRYPFPFSWRHSTSAPIGKLIPLPPKEVLPGDTWRFENISDMVQLTSTFIRPIMDDVYLDTFAWFVPLRILYDDLEQVFGDPNPSAYTKPDLKEIPVMLGSGDSDDIGVPVGTVGDHLGLPTYKTIAGEAYSVLPFRAFAKIWDEYARNQNVDQEMVVQTGGILEIESPNVDPWSPTNYSGQLPPVARFHDYFSTMLLSPQKGPAVRIPGFTANIPVITGSNTGVANQQGMRFSGDYGEPSSLGFYTLGIEGDASETSFKGSSGVLAYNNEASFVGGSFYPSNLWADAADAAGATITNLRTAFQLQKYYERDAIYGSRYREYIYSAYGVETDDASLQIPQLLAHGHHRLDITAVASTSDAVSGETQTYPVGQFAGSSKTVNSGTMRFTKSFTEHGYLMFAFCIRYKHLYSQGIDKLWTRHDRNDFYDPLFANLSMQGVRLDEIYGENSAAPDPIIGYQEAWAEYRTFLSSVSGEMRPNPNGNGIGQYWSLADFYTSRPSLLDIVHETDEPWKRVLSVDPSKQDPFIVDFGFKGILAQVVPYYSTPGYADHH